MGRNGDPAEVSEASTLDGNSASTGVDILLIPPALEFPFPGPSGAPTVPSAEAEAHDGQHVDASRPELATTPGLLEQAAKVPARPTNVKRAATAGRQPGRPQNSLPGLKRGNTLGASRAVFDPTLWESDIDSSSSDDEPLEKHPSRRSKSSVAALSRRSRRGSDDAYKRFAVGNKEYNTKGKVSRKDGRLNISMHEAENKGYLAKTLEATLRHHLSKQRVSSEVGDSYPTPRPQLLHAGTLSTLESTISITQKPYVPENIPRLNLVIMVIGSRGDIQPFLRLGKILKEEHGHRVRIATHPAFREFVEKDSQLEFFSVGGDPAELMAFMVKNPGLLPKPRTIREGEIAKRREDMYKMFQGFWRACINTTDDEHDDANLRMMDDKHPFVADAIIANPPSFAHVHCAERLGIPLHLMFTFPTSPTKQFPHPLANIKQSNIDREYTNFMSYPLVDMMTWQGLGDLVNRFRTKSLDLEPISKLWAPGQLFRMRVPHSYLWSPALIPKPSDWGPEIDITGFVFLDLASSFDPAPELVDFLKAGDPPVYIGFGSIVVDDPEKFTTLVFDAVRKAGVRALVSKGWGGLGDEGNVPDDIFMLGNVPHDWLFPQVSAVVHHGGAGSTAIGLKCGKPTLVVPFFGDQPFWGAMIAKAGAGAEPVPYKHLKADVLAECIKTLLTDGCQKAAKEVAAQIAAEGDGAQNAVNSFHRALPLRGNHSMRCSILEDQVAVWWLKGTHIRLSALAAEVLTQSPKLKWSQLRLVRHYDWNDFEGPGEPLTGFGGAIMHSAITAAKGVGGTPRRWATTIKQSHERDMDSKEELKGSSKSRPQQAHFGQHSSTNNCNESDSPLERHDEKSGVMKRGYLPPANLGRKPRHLIKEFKRDKEAEEDSQMADSHDLPDNNPSISSADIRHLTDEHVNKAHVASGLAAGTGQGLARTGRAIVRAPVDISVALAQGFHNAPRLWGDETVRTPRRITGMKSALRAAREELLYGVSDGVSGLAWQPYHGAKQDGALGFVKGIGKGVGGFILKDLAALAGVPAYTLKGIQKEIRKGSQPAEFLRRAHIIGGRQQFSSLSKDDSRKVVQEVAEGWKIIMAALEKREEVRKSGIAGRFYVHRIQKKWKKHGVYENVEQMDHALNAEQQGRNFDQEFRRHRREVSKAEEVQSPRKTAGTGGMGSVSMPHSPRSSRPSKEVTSPRASIDATLQGSSKSPDRKGDFPESKSGGTTAEERRDVESTDFESSVPSAKPSLGRPDGLRELDSPPDGLEANQRSNRHPADVPKVETDGQLMQTWETLQHVGSMRASKRRA